MCALLSCCSPHSTTKTEHTACRGPPGSHTAWQGASWGAHSLERGQPKACRAPDANLRAARKQRPQGEELCHNSTHCKHVDGRTVVLRPEQHFRSSVPASGHVVCEGRPGPDLPCQPKVCNLDHIPMHQQILCSQQDQVGRLLKSCFGVLQRHCKAASLPCMTDVG